jgi:hypothetical protein
MKEELRKVFINPPKGGNEVGVPTASSMQGKRDQTTLRGSLEAGITAAQANVEHSGRVGQPEVRNYGRGYMETRSSVAPGAPPTFYDQEQDAIDPHALATGGKRPEGGVIRKVIPELRPNLPMPARRTDGKPGAQWAKANGNVGSEKGGIDRNGGI